MVSKHFQNYPFEGVFRRPNFAFEQRRYQVEIYHLEKKPLIYCIIIIAINIV